MVGGGRCENYRIFWRALNWDAAHLPHARQKSLVGKASGDGFGKTVAINTAGDRILVGTL